MKPYLASRSGMKSAARSWLILAVVRERRRLNLLNEVDDASMGLIFLNAGL